MAIELRNCVFIHIPKCGGRWVKQMLISHVKDARYIGDPVYDSHNSPDTDKPVFCVIREPALFAHSLWHHRAVKKNNKYGHKFNWQNYIRLEKECADSDYTKFMEKVSQNHNAVWDYYKFYVAKYPKVLFAKQENLAEDLVRILNRFGEEFNSSSIFDASLKRIGIGKYDSKYPLDDEIRVKINKANMKLSKAFGYI